jgi:hypothetical protein
MSATEHRDDYLELLMETVRQVRHPSIGMLDRIEAMLTPERAGEYVQLLMERCDGMYPSLELLDRIGRMVGALEQYEARQGS